jgi:hypothetical protein
VPVIIAYFAFVFGIGFVLGIVRTLWLVPRVGTRMAELTETPVILFITIFVARWIVRHLDVPSSPLGLRGMGWIGLVFMLIAEFPFIVRLRGLSIRDYVASRDRVAARAYYAALALFAFMPLFVAGADFSDINECVKVHSCGPSLHRTNHCRLCCVRVPHLDPIWAQRARGEQRRIGPIA